MRMPVEYKNILHLNSQFKRAASFENGALQFCGKQSNTSIDIDVISILDSAGKTKQTTVEIHCSRHHWHWSSRSTARNSRQIAGGDFSCSTKNSFARFCLRTRKTVFGKACRAQHVNLHR